MFIAVLITPTTLILMFSTVLTTPTTLFFFTSHFPFGHRPFPWLINWSVKTVVGHPYRGRLSIVRFILPFDTSPALSHNYFGGGKWTSLTSDSFKSGSPLFKYSCLKQIYVILCYFFPLAAKNLNIKIWIFLLSFPVKCTLHQKAFAVDNKMALYS